MATSEIEPYLKIETTIAGGIQFLLESSDTQIVAANGGIIKFYDFIDKGEKVKRDEEKKTKDELNATTKEIFQKIDKDQASKLNRVDMMTYFKTLHTNMGDDYKHIAEVSDECFEDVWHEMDYGETGYISWH